MPTFFARFTKIQLSATDLPSLTTSVPNSTPSANPTGRNEELAAQIAAGEPLSERPLYCRDSGSHMRFLGQRQDMPFFMVHAGKQLFRTRESDRGSRTHQLYPAVPLPKTKETFESEDSDTSLSTLATFTTANDGDSVATERIKRGDKEGRKVSRSLTPAKRSSSGRFIRCPTSPPPLSIGHPSSLLTRSDNQRPSAGSSRLASSTIPRPPTGEISSLPLASTQPALIPCALTLTVHLSKESFVPSCGTKTKHLVQDVKIDVFFNGELTASTYVPARYRGEAHNMVQLTQRFSGRRVDRVAERPWVIVPPGQNADGSLRTSKRNKEAYVGAQERWDRIGQTLEEQGEKFGRNQYGDPSVVGEYLASLSRLEMPEEVNELQRGGGPKFGVIDVVLTLGKGQKDEPEKGYLKEPTRLRLRGFNFNESEKAKEKLMKESVTEPVMSHVEANSLNLSVPASTRFTTPLAPSAAPSAIRRRQSIALAELDSVSGLPAQADPTSGLPGTCDKDGTAMQVSSSTLPDTSLPGVDDSLVPAGIPMSKFMGQRKLDLPSRLAKYSSSSMSVPAASRTRVANRSPSGQFRAALAMEVGNTRASQQKRLRPRQSQTPDLPQSGFISDSNMLSSTHSSPTTVPRNRNARGVGSKHMEYGFLSRRSSRNSGVQGFMTGLESSRDVVTATDVTSSKSEHSNRRTRPNPSSNTMSTSTPHPPQKRYKYSTSTPSEYSKPQRRQYQSGWAVTDKPTLAEEMAQIEASSRQEITTRMETAGNKASTAPKEGKQPSPRQVLKLRVRQPIAPQKTFSSAATHAAEASPTHPSVQTIPRRPRPASNRTAQSRASIEFTPKTAPSPTPRAPRRKRSAATTALGPCYVPVFPTPGLSRDSVLSYAEEPAWETGLGPGNGAGGVKRGVYRQLKAERNGWFEESAVLMGVRFLVG